MEQKFKIEYLPSAVNDLTEIINYIKNDNLPAALNLISKIDESISHLSGSPYMGVLPKDIRLQALGYRMAIVENYIVFYVVVENVIEIRRIVSGKRKYSFLL